MLLQDEQFDDIYQGTKRRRQTVGLLMLAAEAGSRWIHIS